VVGQSAITATLKNSIVRKHLAHAYLFCGPRGVGKTTCARIFAKTINCANPTPDMEACGECESCRSFNEGRSYSIHELDAASNNSVEDIRQLIEQVRIPPQIGQYSVYIIDEVHMLSAQAFNAFLKTLEEPPAHAIFILATTEKHKILPTILSRCQIYDFNRIRVEDAIGNLKMIAQSEGITADEPALQIIAQKADGAMRDALSIFDQVVAFCGSELTYAKVIENLNVLDYDYYFRLTDSFLRCTYTEALLIFDEILLKGFEAQHFVAGLCSHFRDLLVCKDEVTVQLLEASDAIKQRYAAQAKRCEALFLFQALAEANRCDVGYKTSGNPRLHVELCLLRLSYLCAEKKKPDVAEASSSPSAAPATPAVQASAPAASAAPRSTISIKDALRNEPKPPLQPAPAKAESASAAGEDEAITPEKLSEVRELYANALTSDSQRSLRNAMLNAKLSIGADGHTVQLESANELLRHEIEEKKEQLTAFLRKHLRHAQLEVALTAEQVASDKPPKPYGSASCFKYLAEQNPLLNTMKAAMGLDYE
jgi:DNA polymerase-3 subunit gamma/tau